MVAKAQFTIKDLNDIWPSPTPPTETPPVGFLWQNTAVNPNELLAWTGKGMQTDRRYAASKSGASVSFDDLSDDHALGVTVKTVATQAGSGTPSPTNVRAINGKSAVTVRRTGKNLFRLGTSDTQNGITKTVNADGSVALSGDATANAFFPISLLNAVPGTLVLSANNPAANSGVLIRAARADGAVVQDLALSAANAVSAPFPGNEVRQATIRVAAGTTLSGFVLKPQMEIGSAATAFEAYAEADHALTPDAALYGLAGAEDEVGSDGHVTRRTALKAFDGTENWSYSANQPTLSTLARFQYVTADMAFSPAGICSHFPFQASPDSGLTAETVTGHPSDRSLSVYVLKSRMAGWSDAWTNTQKQDAFRALLASWNAAGTPLLVLYQRAAPTSATVAPAAMNGADGMNTVMSDGASVAVAYTGSGWAAVGNVQRVAVEAVSISPEEGLRVDTVLTSGDGTKQVPTYFNARGSKYGLFRASDGEMILGGMVLPNGQPAGVAGALVSPGAAGETRIEIETASEGSGQARVDTAALHLVQPSFAGAIGTDPAPTGERTPIRLEAVRSTLLGAQSEYVDNYSASLKTLNSLRLVALNESGSELAWLLVQRSQEGSTVYTDGAYAASDRARTLSNFAPMIRMSMPASESIVYSATARRYMLDWKTIEDDYGRYATFKGGNLSLRDVGIIIPMSGHYRFVFHVDLEQASSSSGAVLYVNRMPADWTPPTTCDYLTDADLMPQSGPSRIAYRRAACAPLNASVTTCGLVADMWCFGGEKILPVVSTAAASKALVPAGTFFTAQKIG